VEIGVGSISGPLVVHGRRVYQMPGYDGPVVDDSPLVRLYSRRDCHLCEDARAAIESEARRTPLRLEEIFIDGDGELERRYGTRVPVVEVGGAEAFEYHVDPAALRRLLAPCAFVRGRSQSR